MIIASWPESDYDFDLTRVKIVGTQSDQKGEDDWRRFRTTVGRIKKLIDRGQSGPDRVDRIKTILGEMVALRTRYCTLVYVVIRRIDAKILCLHKKISSVCRRITYTLGIS